MFIQLKRFSGAFSNVWPDDKITLPSSASYELCGIGHHLGQSNTSGHYIASVKKNKIWYRCNDTKVSLITEKEAKSLICDICVYSKVSSPTGMHADNVVCNNSKTLENTSEYNDNVQPKCKNCGKSFALLLSHLMRSKKCQIGYDIEMMKNERDREKSKKDTLLKHQWRQQ